MSDSGSEPLVSVIMPCRNAGPLLDAALHSVIGQTWPNLEIIFVDNNSSDGSEARARKIVATGARPFRCETCTTQGSNHARIHGYGFARGDYIQWLDADDELGPDKLEYEIAVLEQDRQASIAYCDWLQRDRMTGPGPVDRHFALAQVDDQIERALSSVWYPPHCYLVRRGAADVLQMAQAWWPERRIGTDLEYSAVAALLGLRFRHVPGTSVVHNVWSDRRTSGAATPYVDRVASLQAIYQRLRTIAARPDIAARITARHRMLLDQDWHIWSVPQDSIDIEDAGSERFQFRHVPSGQVIEGGRHELIIVQAMQALGLRQTIGHHALILAAVEPSLNNDVVAIFAMLDRFRREGLLTAAMAD